MLASAGGAQSARHAPLLQPEHASALAAEISGSAAKRTIDALSLHHRMRASEGIRAAATLIHERLTEYGLSEVEMIALPADGKIYYGTQRSRPAWNASFAELWEQREENGRWRDGERIASWAEQPISLAQDSVSGRAEAELVDIGPGNSPAHYEGKDIRGKLVLTSSQPSAVAALAITQRGAAGIISWAQNQQQAWWGEDESLVRWAHLDTWKDPTFAFAVSPSRARAWQSRLARGEKVRLRAVVEAGRTPGAYTIPTAIIPGRDRGSEIVFSCHLDHPSPGANDNASGCAGILEVARSLHRLIREGKLPQPQRTIRFVWPPEIEGTIGLLAGQPEFARRTLATIHFDMIGGNTEITKSILRVEGSPPSLPSFVNDVAVTFGRFVNEQSLLFADTGAAPFPLVDPQGDKRALQAKVGGFSEGSDHQVWAEGSWRIPVIYLADWPDRYIHTQRDLPANIDPTKLKRAIFIGAASAWYLANLDSGGMSALALVMRPEQLNRTADTMRRAEGLKAAGASEAEIANLWRQHREYEAGMDSSLARFGSVPAPVSAEAARFRAASDRFSGRISPAARGAGPFAVVYERVETLKGPMTGFGYSWFDDHLQKAGLERPKLLARQAQRGSASFDYEALNLVDGRRSVQQIRDYLSATSGPVPVEEVADYLAVLQRLGVLRVRGR
jgi:hypothetical protein